VELEESKCALSILADFNVLQLFREFDVRHRNLLDFQDFKEGLCCAGLDADLDLFKAQDWDGDGYWMFADFCEVFLPDQPSYARLLLNRIPFSSSPRSPATEAALACHWQSSSAVLPRLAAIKPQLVGSLPCTSLTESEAELLAKFLERH
jgi:hypothetical protein